MKWRTDTYDGPPFDIAIGPSADGDVKKITELYKKMVKKNHVDNKKLLKKLKPHLLGEQIVFKNEKAIKGYLTTLGYEKYEVDRSVRHGKVRNFLQARLRGGPRNI
jgi:hypothetical protein